MPNIMEFTVVQPPTSGEVRNRALEALQSHSSLKLVILPRQVIPTPQFINVEMDVRQMLKDDDEGMRIGGTDADGNSIRILTDLDPDLPASASVVYTDR